MKIPSSFKDYSLATKWYIHLDEVDYNSYKLEPLNYMTEEISLHGDKYTDSNLYSMNVKFFNKFSDEIELNKGIIYATRITRDADNINDVIEIELPYNINWNSSVDNIIDAYGEPTSRIENKIIYSFELNKEVIFTFEENQELIEIQLVNIQNK